ncbi:hypothetical protein, partial [Desulfonatronospira sp.]|uniref:hypothetical protein n=1 Tax=Desulfonatronospira sp. TaxID=1962951 RepID=UPI0025C22AD9
MNPYSHLVVASELEAAVAPDDIQEYYWGAIAPDIRYIAGMQRQQTHLPPQDIMDSIYRYPHLRSFLQGYLVHCLCDEIELDRIFSSHFPFFIIKNKMTPKKSAVLLELFYLENKRVDFQISGTCNEFMQDLGLSRDLTDRFSRAISRYTALKSPQAGLGKLLQLLGLEGDPRINSYVASAESFQKSWLKKNILFLAIKAGGIHRSVVS